MSAADRIFQNAVFRCTVCSAEMGDCDCWTLCGCGWSYAKGTSCKNPKHVPGSEAVPTGVADATMEREAPDSTPIEPEEKPHA